MSFGLYTKCIRTYLIDHPAGTVLMVAQFLLKLCKSSPVALWRSLVTRVTALLLPASTDHSTGLVRFPYWLPVWVKRALAIVFSTAPSVFHFSGLDAWNHCVLATVVLLTTLVSMRQGERYPKRTSTAPFVMAQIALDEAPVNRASAR